MENKNQIIEAECRDITAETELNNITAEIRVISEQMNRTLLTGIIEIGRRFDRAKTLVPYGQWGEWCETATGYKQSMAENYIKAYKEYGAEQFSIFGDLTKSQSIGNLGITKLIELTALPAEAREAFVEENNVTESTTVKELRELIRKQKDDLSEAADKEIRLMEQIDSSNKMIAEKRAEIDHLKYELESMSAPTETAPDGDEMAAMIADAEEKVREETKKQISKLEREVRKQQKETDEIQKKYDELKGESEKSGKDIRGLKDSLAEAENKNKDLAAEIARLKKESMLGANESLVRLDMFFETAQSDISRVAAALDGIKGQEMYAKLREAIYVTLAELVDRMKPKAETEAAE